MNPSRTGGRSKEIEYWAGPEPGLGHSHTHTCTQMHAHENKCWQTLEEPQACGGRLMARNLKNALITKNLGQKEVNQSIGHTSIPAAPSPPLTQLSLCGHFFINTTVVETLPASGGIFRAGVCFEIQD